MDSVRIRIRFCKEGDLRLISHRDLMRVWERLFRRANLPLALSQGFHPKPRVSFPSALGLGVEGKDEIMDVHLAADANCEDLQSRLAKHTPPGLTIKTVNLVEPGTPKLQVQTMTYELTVPEARREQTAEAIAELKQAPEYEVTREGRKLPLDLKALLRSVSLDEGKLQMQIVADPGGTLRPDEVLQVLKLNDLMETGFPLTRTQVEINV